MAGMRLGVLVPLDEQAHDSIKRVQTLGFPTCQVACWQPERLTQQAAQELRQAADAVGVEITTIWAGTPGLHVWDFIQGPRTIGLLPAETRPERLKVLKRGADFAAWAGVAGITTHVGFIPEDPGDPAYRPLVAA